MCARASPQQRAWQAARCCLGDHRDGELLHTATEGQWLLVPEVPLQGATATGTPCRSLLHMQEADGETKAPMGEDLTGGHTEGHWWGNQDRVRSPAPQPWTLQTSRGHTPRTHSQEAYRSPWPGLQFASSGKTSGFVKGPH